MDKVKVAAVDDHGIVLIGLAALLDRVESSVVLETTVATVPELLATGETYDIVLLDLRLNDGSVPVDNIAAVLGTGAKVLVLTTETRPVPLRDSLEAGAAGVISKNEPPERIIEAILEAHAGREVVSSVSAAALVSLALPRLSGRQLEVVALIAEGLPRKSIARRLGISQATVNEHYARTVEQLRNAGEPATNAVGVVAITMRDGYLDPPA